MSTHRPFGYRTTAPITAGVRASVVLLLVAMLNLLTAPAGATGRASAPLPPHTAELLQAARAHGSARVIVGVSSSAKLEGDASDPAAIERQRAGIARAQQTLLQRHAGRNLRLLHSYELIPFMAMEVDAATIEALAADSGVSGIYADEKQSAALFDNVKFIGGDAQNTFNGFSGTGQTVAILDTGVKRTHPYLKDKVVSEACYSTPNTADGEHSLCPNGATSQVGTGAAVPTCDFVLCDHGTHVAGIAAGRRMTVDFTDFGKKTLSGVAKGATIIAIQVFERNPNNTISTYVSDQIKGLMRVYDLRNQFKIAAVNMSLGGGRYTSKSACDSASQPVKAAIDKLRTVGIATIVSSGNAGYTDSMSSPACISTAISVGSVTYDANGEWISDFSNRASWLSLYAPGDEIVSAGFGHQANGDIATGGWTVKNGTSQAAPHVTGAWAVLREKAPTATIAQILSALQSTGKSVPDDYNSFVKKRIRVNLAVNQLSGGTCTDAFEPNGDAATAKIFTVGNTESHTFCASTDRDWVKFTATANREYRIETLSLGTNVDTILTLYQPNGTTQITTNDNASSSTKASLITRKITTAGTYYVRVHPKSGSASGSAATYKLRITVAAVANPCTLDEPNNTSSTAATFTPLGSKRDYAFCASLDEDWVKFTVTAGSYRVETLSLAATVDTVLVLYDSSGNYILEDDGANGAPEVILVNLAAGTYRVQVFDYNNTFASTAKYSLRIGANSGGRTVQPVFQAPAGQPFEEPVHTKPQ